jgi:L-ectoine synthase
LIERQLDASFAAILGGYPTRQAGLVTTQKIGRVRTCRLGPRTVGAGLGSVGSATRTLTGMIIRSVRETLRTARDVHGSGGKSRRRVLADEDIGYSVHETTLEPGIDLRFEYAHHRETVYCVSGEGQVEDLTSGRTADLAPGGLYSAGIGEPHRIVTTTEMRLLCVFTPPLAGSEEAD